MRFKNKYVNKCKAIVNPCKAKNVRLATSMPYLDTTDTRLFTETEALGAFEENKIKKLSSIIR